MEVHCRIGRDIILCASFRLLQDLNMDEDLPRGNKMQCFHQLVDPLSPDIRRARLRFCRG